MRSLIFSLLLLSLPMMSAAATLDSSHLGVSKLGNDGEIYTLLTGEYASLFPEGSEVNGASSVLALHVEHADGATERLLVPATEGSAPETIVGLLYDRNYATLTALWQHRGTAFGKMLRLAHFDGATWSSVTTLKDPTWAPIVRTETLVTRDRYLIDVENDVPQMTERTILHLVWTADDGGVYDVRYSPIIFLDGTYIGWNETISLRDLLIGEAPDSTPALAREMELALSLSGTRDGQRLQVAFANAVTGDLNVVNIGVLPLELTVLSDAVGEVLVDLRSLYDPEELSILGDVARIEIIGTGLRHKLNKPLVSYVASEIRTEILAIGDEYEGHYDDLVEHLQQLAIQLTTPLVTSELSYLPGLGDSQVLQIDLGDLLGAGQPTQMLDVHVLGSVPAPITGDGPTSIFLSPSADALIVAWEDEEAGRLYWRERLAENWGPVRALNLENLTIEGAHELLHRRVR